LVDFKGSGGEGGIRTPGTGFSQYNGLANCPFHSLVFGINKLRSGEMPDFRAKGPYSGAFVQLLCNPTGTASLKYADVLVRYNLRGGVGEWLKLAVLKNEIADSLSSRKFN
jgi:hypothetical protein